ncbi:hypothetical protein [Burkholderia anthina]|uniref:hypothetical protein n=1 Tax=Burkholderia anthina TaxID=179879 RepID=UPI00075DB055|nr:hypothetical protein [Burkholderia anthina]KVN65660.1 hypothetical protein WT13_06260 [Burkholderia anthina]RQV80039.1 hypothetical protein DF160_17950 [Burkholderia anthina]
MLLGLFNPENGMIDVRTTALADDLKRVAQQQSNLSDYAAQLTRQFVTSRMTANGSRIAKRQALPPATGRKSR